ncbi:hypothetical protein KQ51_00469 [Candidatus Izimaplasma bacterium HR1]|jgi:cytochrome b561|uniref:DUF2178 domain-containing protein n=1 Tax=Candidatus Izimoplasma sp. HR1 TaxID=1541959 RepID=UPI0004F7F751|nr:hypothetical protein KQ51_00469 [Candidatus Izimaplasma bacterium HR1]
MDIRRKSSLINGIVWLIVLLSIILFFFPALDLTIFSNPKIEKLVGSLIILIGIVVNFILLFRNKKEVTDERMIKIQAKSMQFTALSTMMYVFLFCMVMYDINKGQDISREWFWFLGYSSFCLFYTLGSLSYYVIDSRGIGYDN